MILFKKIPDLQKKIHSLKSEIFFIGFVPTMGALHEGHLSLIQLSKKQNDLTVCSIFINPAQFNNKEDLEHYPVTLEKDIRLLERIKTDILFLPSVEEMYLNNEPLPHFDLGYLENIFEGKYRPGHFQGVCIIVDKLLKIIQPNNLYLGQKDYQQCLLIKKMLAVTGNHTDVIIAPTKREKNGLAMSSRNLRLDEATKQHAAAIYNVLIFIKENYKNTTPNKLILKASEMLINNGFSKIDYIEIADAHTLNLPGKLNSEKSLIALIAAWINGVRLIDNMPIN